MNIFTYFPKGKNNLNSLVIKIHNFNLINNKIIFLDDNNLKKYNINSKFFSLSLKNKIFLIKFIILSQEGGFFFDIGSLIIKNLDFLHNKFISADKNLYYDNEELNGVIFMKKDTNLLIKINEFINNTNDLNIIKKNIIKFIKNYYTKSEFIKNTNSDYFINIDNQICKKKIIFENKTIQKFKLNNIINKKNFFYFNLPIIYKLNNNNIIDFLLNNENSIFKFLLNNEKPKKKISIMTNIKDELDLQEWICYYIYILKFDYIFIYDNGSENSVHDLVNKYFQDIKEKIYVIYFPGRQIKPKARLHYNKNYLHLSDWTLFIDGDEYLCLKGHEDIHEFINQDIFIGVEQIAFNWLLVGSEKKLYREENKLLIERFTNCLDHNRNNLIKVLVKNISIIKNNYIHPHYLITKNNTIVDIFGNKIKLCQWNNFIPEYNSFILHYHFKSKEEWIYKCDVVKKNGGRDDIESLVAKSYDFWNSELGIRNELFLKDNYTNKLRELIYGKNNLQKNINYLSKSLIEKKNLFFIHIPKNAGSSIEEISYKKNILWGMKYFQENKKKIKPVKQINGIWHIPPKYFKDNTYKNKILFSVVRNPYERIISEFKWRKKINYISKNMDINDFIKENINKYKKNIFHYDGHFIPQSEFIYGYPQCDEILRFENLDSDFYNLLNKYKYPPMKLLHENKSYGNTTVDSLNKDSIAIINKIYKDDFENFGYKMIK